MVFRVKLAVRLKQMRLDREQCRDAHTPRECNNFNLILNFISIAAVQIVATHKIRSRRCSQMHSHCPDCIDIQCLRSIFFGRIQFQTFI